MQRIRAFRTQSHQIASPVVGTAVTGDASTVNGGIGDCTTDTFSITSPGNTGSPVICGFNDGQHS